MQQIRRLLTTPDLIVILALILLCLPAMQPFLQGQMPRTDDGTLHLYRSIALEHAMRTDQSLYPRYAPGLVYGYGAALFNYFPPTSYFAVVGFLWMGFAPVNAWLAAMCLYVLVGALGAFKLGTIWGGNVAGWITAAAFTYAPYMLFDTVTRGTISEVAGLVLMPWVFWGFTVLAWRGSRRDFLVAVGAFAAFILMHNIVTLHGTFMLALYALTLCLTAKQVVRTFASLLIAGVLALILTAFFWAPALTETAYTRIQGVTENLNSIDVTNSLRPLSEILALPRTADPAQLQAPIPITLGWVQILIGGIGAMLGWRRANRQQRALVLFLITIIIGNIVLQMDQLAAVWRSVPLIGYSQFAWRILGTGTLALALLAGLGGVMILNRIPSKTLKNTVFSIFLALIGLYGIPWLYTPYFTPSAQSITDAQEYERQTGQLTLSSYSEYLPVWVESEPDPDALVERFAASETIPRINTDLVSGLIAATWRGSSAELQFNTDLEQTLVFDWLYMPGWYARVEDSQSSRTLDVFPETQSGLVAVQVPAGTYRLTIGYTGTDIQQQAKLISAMAILAALCIFTFWRWQVLPFASETDRLQQVSRVVLVAVALFALKTLVIDRVDNPLRDARYVNSNIEITENAINADFSGFLRLIGSIDQNAVKSGENADFSLFWALSDQEIEQDFSSIIEIVDDRGHVIAQSRAFYPGGIATSQWIPGMYVEQSGSISLPPFTPPGTYTLLAGVYAPETGAALDVLDAVGNPVGVRVQLDEIIVERPSSMPAWDGQEIGRSAEFVLLAIDGIPEQAQVGDEITFQWLWEALQATPQQAVAALVWLNEGGTEIARSADLVLVNQLDVSDWRRGDRWRGWQRVYVPGNLEAGEYTVALSSADMLVPVTTMRVTTPERRFDMPAPEFAMNTGWLNGIELLGADYSVTMVTLYWRTSLPVNQSLRLFVQALTPDGQVVAVSDGIPVNWTRPTTGWAVGEVLSTTHDFATLGTGSYTLLVGWYDAASGIRQNLVNYDGDALTLPEPLIIE